MTDQALDHARSQSRRIAELADQGELKEALALSRRQVEELEEALGGDHHLVAVALRNQAGLQQLSGDFDGAEEAYRHSLRILEASDGPVAADVAETRLDFAHLLFLRGKLQDALSLADRARASFEHQLGTADPLTAKAVGATAVIQKALGNYDEAEMLYRQSLEVLQRQHGRNHPEVATVLTNLGKVMIARADYDGALWVLEEALEIHERLRGPVHPAVANALNALGTARRHMGDGDAVQSLFERALEISTSRRWADPLLLAGSMENLAAVAQDNGDLPSARRWLKRSLDVVRRAEHLGSAQLGWSLRRLGSMLAEQGDYRSARGLLEEATELTEADLGDQHPDTAACQNDLGELLRLQGDLPAARRCHAAALAIRQEALGPAHHETIATLNNLGLVLQEQGDLTAAEPCFERALAVTEKQFGPTHPRTARALDGLGGFRYRQGRFDESQRLHARSLAIGMTALGPTHPDVAVSLNNLATASLQTGTGLEDAQAALQNALAIWRQALGDAHPNVAQALVNLTLLHMARGESEKARAAVRQALRVESQITRHLLPTLSEHERLLFTEARRSTLDLQLSLLAEESMLEEAYEAVLDWKGIARRVAMHQRAVVRAADDPGLRHQIEELSSVQRRIATLVHARRVSASERSEFVDLNARRATLERALWSGGDDRAGGEPESRLPSLIAALRPDGPVLVDFVRYQRYGVAPGHEVLAKHACYVAFVLRPGQSVERIELGPALRIEQAIEGYRRIFASPRSSSGQVGDAGQLVRELLWDPVVAAGDHEQVVIVPDGAVVGVSFACLPGLEGRHLVDDHCVAYAESAMDVVRWAGGHVSTGSGVVVVGGVDYDHVATSKDQQSSHQLAQPSIARKFRYLEGTLAEAEVVAEVAEQLHPSERVEILTGLRATEDNVAAKLGGCRIAHLATHGFFLAKDAPDSRIGCADARTLRRVAAVENPMVLSGIALAGANVPAGPLDHQDGIWTALEMATLDLPDTELVVLSACETGLGEVRSGEGVLGLRRALSIAGVRSLVMSLWSVPDASTAKLMQSMYRNMATDSLLGPVEALRQAQLDMVRSQRKCGTVDPRKWGAFIAAGPFGAISSHAV